MMAARNLPRLSPREQEVCALLSDGRANKEIAGIMGLTPGTIKEYLHRIMLKTGAKNRLELALRWRFDRRNLTGNLLA